MSSLAIGFINNVGILNPLENNPVEGNGLDGRDVKVIATPVGVGGGGGAPAPNCCKAFFTRVWAVIQEIFGFLAHAFSSHNNMQAAAKLGKSVIGLSGALGHQTVGFNNLNQQLNIVDSAIDFVDVFVEAKDWLVPKEDPFDKKDKFFLKHEGVTKWKIISKSFGFVAKALGAFKFLVDVGLLELAKAALLPFRVVKDIIASISAAFAVADHGVELHKQKLKHNKWIVKNDLRDFLSKTPEEKQAKLEEVFKGQEVPVDGRENRYLEQLKGSYLSAREALIKFGVRLKAGAVQPERKWQVVNERYNNVDAMEANADKCEKKLSDKKVLQTKNWLAIAFNVVKIAAIAIGLVGALVSAIGGTIPFLLTLAVGWFLTSSVGMARVYYHYKHKHLH